MRTLLGLLLIFSVPAFADNFMYQDAAGQTWTRHVLHEKRQDSRTLLLVVDEPANGQFMPQVVLRKSFAREERQSLLKYEQVLRAPHLHPTEALPLLTPTNNPIWPIDHQWTQADEDDYANWIAANANEGFLQGGGIDVDCADYAITLRWIYAHDHHLPAGQQLAISGELWGSWESTADWDKLPTNSDWKQDARFKAALTYILEHTFTHSLFTDLYPVAINPTYVRPSTIFLTLTDGSGHTRTLTTVGDNPNCEDAGGCMIIIWGNEPASEFGYVTSFVPYRLNSDEGGFLRFRWPEKGPNGWALRPAANMPGYSTEQYSWGDDTYLSTVATRLKVWNTPEARFQITGDSAEELLMQRLAAVVEGYFRCSLVPCSPNDPIYNDWSTPVRDKAIQNSVKLFQTAAAQLDPNSSTVTEFKNSASGPMFDGAPFSMNDILFGSLANKFNSDPTADFFARWGVTATNEQKLVTYAAIINYLWSEREDQVDQGYMYCYQGTSKSSCDPNDPKVKAFSTPRIDQAFRVMHGLFAAEFQKASAQTQDEITGNLQQYTTNQTYCGTGSDECTVYDYVLGTKDHWATMTSEAYDPYKSRYGF